VPDYEIKMTERLTYRLYQDSDLPGLLRLWEGTKLGGLSPELWRQRYVDAPHGPSLMPVAVDEYGDVAGHLVFTPSRVTLGAREVSALSLSAGVLRKDLSRVPLHSTEHPTFGLYRVGEEAALAGGYSLWYSLPRRAWLPMVPLLSRFAGRDIAVAEYDCVGSTLVQVPPGAAKETRFLIARLAKGFGAQYEALWRFAKESFPIDCGVVRSPDWLSYNNKRYLTIEVLDKRDGMLAGYAMIRRQPPLLEDILAREPSELYLVLSAALDWLALREGEAVRGGLCRLDAMETPALRPALRALGFTPVNYRFAFVCAALDRSIPVEAITPERWYVTPVDHGQ
jgi:hypothetical protein